LAFLNVYWECISFIGRVITNTNQAKIARAASSFTLELFLSFLQCSGANTTHFSLTMSTPSLVGTISTAVPSLAPVVLYCQERKSKIMPGSSRSGSRSSSIDDVVAQQAAVNVDDNNNIVRLEEGSWCNVEVSNCIIHAIPIVDTTTTTRSSIFRSGAGGDDDSSSIAITRAPTLQSLSRSFGATFDSTDDDEEDEDHGNSSNVVIAPPGEGDDVILVMDEESGGVESSIVATATAKSIFVPDRRNTNRHQQLETTMSTTDITIATTATSIECTARAEFVSATFIKKTADDVMGITVAPDNNNRIRIAAIHDDIGILSHRNNCPFRVGDQLLSISGQSCFELDTGATAAQHLLEQAMGIVSLVARNPTGSVQYIETMVEKPSPQSPVGIAMKNTDYGSLVISNVVASGLFAHSLLNVGVVPSAEVGNLATVIPTDAEGRPLSAVALNSKSWRRHICAIVLTAMMVIAIADLLMFHPVL
jgi:hypothetical protein